MKKIVVFSVLLIAMNACKKDDDKPMSKADLLTSGTWAMTAAVSDDDGDGTFETNEFADFESCFTDNIWTFNSNGSAAVDEGPTKCDPADSQVVTANWQMTNNETNLTLDGDTYLIEQLDATTLILKMSYGFNSSSKVTFSKR
jgi:hypothetical protein